MAALITGLHALQKGQAGSVHFECYRLWSVGRAVGLVLPSLLMNDQSQLEPAFTGVADALLTLVIGG